ncbi:hypothetical protein [Segatella oris]|uniref:hypothetical protein n=1 Tax=Segatella oris TaxID=28135 RepID=UPI0028E78259|nr:hypothetical protein [Segatella oris]
MKNIAIVAFLCLITTACTKKIHAEDIGFHNDTVYYEGQPFTGEIWTSDNTTGCIVTEKGIMKSLTFYHSKDKHAVVMTLNDGIVSKSQCYDEQGDSIDIISFEVRYQKLWIKMFRVQGELIKAYQRDQPKKQQDIIVVH